MFKILLDDLCLLVLVFVFLVGVIVIFNGVYSKLSDIKICYSCDTDNPVFYSSGAMYKILKVNCKEMPCKQKK